MNRGKLGNNGFSIIELSIVLVVVGLLITVSVGVMNTLNKKSKLTREKDNLKAIENSLVSYALSHGKLPLPDAAHLPYVELQYSPAEKDVWGLPYQYDVTDILTTTSSQNICVTLYLLDNLYSWYGKPVNAPCNASNMVCVTNTADGSNDGRIASSGNGYYVAAYFSSMGQDHKSGGKNSNTNREYEMSSNPYDVTLKRDDLVEELTFAELAGKLCNVRNTIIEVSVDNGEIWLDNSQGCAPGTGISTSLTIFPGQTLYFGTGCSNSETFEQLARCNMNPAVYTGTNSCVAGSSFDGKVNVNGVTKSIIQ